MNPSKKFDLKEMDESVSDTVQRTNKSLFLIGCGKVGK